MENNLLLPDKFKDSEPSGGSGGDRPDAPDAPERRKLRLRTIRFVAGFVVLVLTFLTGYRYALNTEANMWYLFKVASHTTWALERIGDHAEVEPYRAHSSASRKRIELAQWRGEDTATDVGSAAETNAEPLTRYESWLHKAYKKIDGGGDLQQYGPTVHFVAEEGLQSKRSNLRRELAALQNARSPDAETASADAEGMQEEIDVLDAQIAALPQGPEKTAALRDVQFSFQVVPDCGAIPSISIFLAAVIAFPTLILHRIIGAIAGVAVLYGINISRLATLGYIGAVDVESGHKWFNFIHEYVWQGIFIIFVVMVWMAWIEFVVKARQA